MRIDVFSASVGAGHVRAAQAVELALRATLPTADIRNTDVLTLTNAAFRRVYGTTYLDLVNHAPHLLGYMYDMLDKPSTSGKARMDRLRRLVEKLNLAAFIKEVKGGRGTPGPDLVVNTHFLSAGIIAGLRRKRRLAVPQVTVVTDFDAHRLWVNEPTERYFVATEDAAATLGGWDVDRERITITGIPIHPVFAEPKERAAACERLGLAGDRPIVLQLAGGFGVGPIEAIHQSILAVPTPLEVVVVAGKNAEAKKKVESLPCPKAHRRTVLGFTDRMDELLAAADLVVSKPGGLTTSETLARGAVMVIVDPIPGQEGRNSDYLLENGVAIKSNSLAALPGKIERLLADPKRLATMKARSKSLGHPDAAFAVAKAVAAMVR